METKSFELITYIYKNGKTFHENEVKETEQSNLFLGYFEQFSNISINDCTDGSYLICYICSNTGEHKIIKINDKFDLISNYNELLINGQDESYISIFDLNDIIYV